MAESDRRSDKQENDLPKTVKRVLASTIALVIAFIIAQGFLQWLIYILATSLKYDCVYTYNEAFVPMDYHLWTRWRVMGVDFIPPFVCLLIALSFYNFMSRQGQSWGQLQMPAFWLMVCFGNVFFSQLLFSPMGVYDPSGVFYQTFARVALWVNIPPVLSSVFAIIAAVSAIGVGYFLCMETMKLSPSYRLTEKRAGKNLVILIFYIIPVLLAATPLLLLAKGESTGLRTGAILIGLLIPPLGMYMRTSVGPFQVRYQRVHVRIPFLIVETSLAIALWAAVYAYWR